jgi:hypothetical protein
MHQARVAAMYQQTEGPRSELDSHADTCCVGDNALVLYYHNRTVSVAPFLDSFGTEDQVPIVTAAIAYDDPINAQTYVLIVHQALYFGDKLPHNLINPFQCRLNEVRINECARVLTNRPDDSSHSIEFTKEQVKIPLRLNGIVSYFASRRPTLEEYHTCVRLQLTPDEPEWNPLDPTFGTREERMIGDDGNILRRETPPITSREIMQVSIIHNGENLLHQLDSHVRVSSIQSSSRSNAVTAEQLSKRWNIGLDKAKKTLLVTTQRGTRTVAYPSMDARFRTNDRQLRYRRLKTALYTDTMFASTVSTRGNTCAQIFVNDLEWVRSFPMARKGDAHTCLDLLFPEEGVPNTMIMDDAKELIGGEFRSKCRRAGCYSKEIEPYSPWMNRAEGTIRELKRACRRAMIKSGSPKRLWDYCLELQSRIRSNIAHSITTLGGQTPETLMSGETADISNLCEHEWFQWIWYRDEISPFPNDSKTLGRYLGPAKSVGPEMCCHILKPNGRIIQRTTVGAITPAEFNEDALQSRMEDFMRQILQGPLGSAMTESDPLTEGDEDTTTTPSYEAYGDDIRGDEPTMPEGDLFTIDAFDKYIGAQLQLPLQDAMASATVIGRKQDSEGNPVGRSNSNPLLDTRVYDVSFPDGSTDAYAANVIAENMYAQVDEEGRQYNTLDELVDHRHDDTAVTPANAYVTLNGKQHPKRTTQGWQLCVKWKDGSTSWEELKDLKEANPIETAEYALAHSLDSAPAFSWWVSHTLKKRDRIISAVRARFVRKEYKFGIKVPNTIAEARLLDIANGDTFWEKSIEKEMKNVRVAFSILDDDKNLPVDYQRIPCRLLFDVKLDFTRKTRLVAGGHVTDPPAIITYASVVSRESVRIALLIAALNDCNVLGADISNAYLTAPTTERVWTVLGPEWGADAGRRAIIVRALYGLKSSGAAYRNHLASYLRELNFSSCLADPDVWLRTARRQNGETYYEYLLVYVDDLLAISEQPQAILNDVNTYFHLKPESVGTPNLYLGAKLSKTTLPNGVTAWCNSSHRYVQEAIRNTEKYIQEHGGKMLRKKTQSPMENHYRPELDVSPLLDPDRANYYQSQLGILRWTVELGRMDIATEVSMLAAHNALPREGHLAAVFRIYSYLKTKPNARLVFDPTYSDIDYDSFPQENWKDFYGDVSEAIPPNAPPPLGKPVEVRCYVDADHAGDKLTRRSRTGIIIFLNNAPIVWYTKKQNTVETSSFGSEFVALKVATEMLRGLRYKLRMMGISIAGPTYIYCDNNSVVINSSRPASTLKKKSNSIAYHCVRESVAADEQRVTYESTHTNLADLMTKPVPGGTHRDHMVGSLLCDIVPAAPVA